MKKKLFPERRVLSDEEVQELRDRAKAYAAKGGKYLESVEMKVDEKVSHTTIPNSCPECGEDVHDGTGTGWEICKNPNCKWMG